MNSPSPSGEEQDLPWIIKPGTYDWIDGLFDKPIQQWGAVAACVLLCMCCVFVILLLLTSKGEKTGPTFSSYMKDAMRKKLIDLTL
jgi:hypothetical protein